MKVQLKTLVIAAMCIFIQGCSHSQIKETSDKRDLPCSLELLQTIEGSIGQLSEKQVAEFYSTFSSECAENVEFSEWWNELLFEILSRYPEKSISALDQKKNYDIEAILDEASNPVHDNIDLDGLVSILKKTQTDSEIKKRIVQKIEEAKRKY